MWSSFFIQVTKLEVEWCPKQMPAKSQLIRSASFDHELLATVFQQLCSVFSSSFSCPWFLSSPVKVVKALLKHLLCWEGSEIGFMYFIPAEYISLLHYLLAFAAYFSIILPKKRNLKCWAIISHCFCSSLKQTNQTSFVCSLRTLSEPWVFKNSG